MKSKSRLNLAAGSQPDDFVELFVAHERRILSFVASLLPNLADAEDVLQEVSRVLWEKFHEFQPGTSFSAWAFQIAKLKVLEHRRRQSRQRVTFSGETLERLAVDAAKLSEESELRHRTLDDCLRELSPPHRQLIETRYRPQGSLNAAAQQYGRSVVTTRKVLRRVHALLFNCIQRRLKAAES